MEQNCDDCSNCNVCNGSAHINIQQIPNKGIAVSMKGHPQVHMFMVAAIIQTLADKMEIPPALLLVNITDALMKSERITREQITEERFNEMATEAKAKVEEIYREAGVPTMDASVKGMVGN